MPHSVERSDYADLVSFSRVRRGISVLPSLRHLNAVIKEGHVSARKTRDMRFLEAARFWYAKRAQYRPEIDASEICVYLLM